MKYFFLSVSILFLSISMAAQGVGIGTGSPAPSAALDISSTSKGVLLPRLSTSQRLAIPSPATGLLVFDTEKGLLYLYDGVQWIPFAVAASPNSMSPKFLPGPNGTSEDYFGARVNMSGNLAVIGCPGYDHLTNTDQGCAYIFQRNGATWTMQAQLLANDGAAGDAFGVSVAISGNYVVVGADGDNVGTNQDQGSAYVFFYNGTTWVQQARLLSSDGAASDRFGNCVSIAGDYIVAGATGNNNYNGAAYMFFRNGTTWSQQARLVSSDGVPLEGFASAVHTNGNYTIVGAPFDDIQQTAEGSAYVYFRTGTSWAFQAKLSRPLGGTLEQFGTSVFITNDRAFAGSPGQNLNNTPNNGSVQLFTRNGTAWIRTGELRAPDGAENDAFGFSLSVSGEYMAVSAPQDDNGPYFDQGSVYIYKLEGFYWRLVKKVEETPASSTELYMGSGVSVENKNVLIGARGFRKNAGAFFFWQGD